MILARSTEDVSRGAGALAALALHVLAALALLSYEPARSALLAAAPVMVDLITPPRIEPKPQPPMEIPPPPRPKPVAKPVEKRPDPPPVLAAPVEAPSPVEVAPPPPAPIIAVTPPVIEVTAPIFSAVYLENPPPAYPGISRRVGEQGRVILRVLVNAGGSADEVQVRESSGHARLDNAARDTVRGWRFVPAKRGDTPVPAWVLIPVSFRLES
mgnify:CR=1 FL=1